MHVCITNRLIFQPAALRNENRSEAQLADIHDVIIGLGIEIKGSVHDAERLNNTVVLI